MFLVSVVPEPSGQLPGRWEWNLSFKPLDKRTSQRQHGGGRELTGEATEKAVQLEWRPLMLRIGSH